MKSRTQKLCDNFIYYRTKLSRSKMFFCRDIFKWVAFLESDIFPNLTARWCLNRLIQTAFIFCAQLKKKRKETAGWIAEILNAAHSSPNVSPYFSLWTLNKVWWGIRETCSVFWITLHQAGCWLQSSRSVVSRLLLIKLKSSTLITSTVCHIRRSTVRELCNWLVKVNRWSVNCSVSLWVSGDDLITDQLNMNEFILQ